MLLLPLLFLLFMLFLLFIRFLPLIAVSEVKGVLPEADPHHRDWQSLRDKRRQGTA